MGCYGCGNQNCLWIKNHLFSVSLHAHPWGFIKGGLLHLANLLTKKLQHLSLCWSSLDVSYMMVWSQSSSTPTLAVFNKMIQLRWVILTMAYWCLCQTACVKRGVFSGGEKHETKSTCFLAKCSMCILVATVVLHISGTWCFSEARAIKDSPLTNDGHDSWFQCPKTLHTNLGSICDIHTVAVAKQFIRSMDENPPESLSGWKSFKNILHVRFLFKKSHPDLVCVSVSYPFLISKLSSEKKLWYFSGFLGDNTQLHRDSHKPFWYIF